MDFAQVAATARTVAATSSRIAKTAALAQALRAAGPDAPIVATYLSGALPQGRIGVGWSSLTELPPPAASGAEPLTVAELDRALTDLATLTGPGSAGRRKAALDALFARADAAEQDLLRALLLGEIRTGALAGVMTAAIAAAAGVPQEAVRRAVMYAGMPGPVAAAALAGGEAALAAIGLRVGRPVQPMLAGSAPDVAGAFKAMATGAGVLGTAALVQAKLDGIRIQVHRSGSDVAVFTRSLDDVTARLPEVVETALALPVTDAVLDGEAIALDPRGRPEPFQITGARTASRGDPALLRTRTPLTTYLFDLLHLDGADLVDLPLARRLDLLAPLLPARAQVPGLVTGDPDEAQRYFQAAVADGQEGVVVKDLASAYSAGRRGSSWIKVKPRHTLDLVVLAVEPGSGRRRGWLSNIHLGARDPDTGSFVMVGKTFKGMTDEMLRWQTERFEELAVRREPHVVWLRPEQVVEIAFDGVQRSRRYAGGLALRFARVIRYRDDKSAHEADSMQSLRALLP